MHAVEVCVCCKVFSARSVYSVGCVFVLCVILRFGGWFGRVLNVYLIICLLRVLAVFFCLCVGGSVLYLSCVFIIDHFTKNVKIQICFFI